jgi:hypothetical protein
MPRFRDPASQQYYRAARALFWQAGLPFSRLQEATEWAEGLPPNMRPEELVAAFQGFAQQRGWSDSEMQSAIQVHTGIGTHGADAYVAAPSREDAQAAVAHAEQLLKSDPNSYWANPGLQEAYQESLDFLNAEPPAAEPPGRITNSPVYRDAVRSGDVNRRAEIERAMRENNGREYWASPAMQSELRDIIGRQAAPADAMDPGAQPVDGGAAPSGGSAQTDGATVNGF